MPIDEAELHRGAAPKMSAASSKTGMGDHRNEGVSQDFNQPTLLG